MTQSIIKKISLDSLAKIIEYYDNNDKVIIYQKDNMFLQGFIEQVMLDDVEDRYLKLYNQNCEFNIYDFEGEFIFKFFEEDSFMNIYLYENLTMLIDDVEYNDFINLYNELEGTTLKPNKDSNYEEIGFLTALDYNKIKKWNGRENYEIDIIEISSLFMLKFLDDYLKGNMFEIKKGSYDIKLINIKWDGTQYTHKRIYGDEYNTFEIGGFEESYIEIIAYYYDYTDEIEVLEMFEIDDDEEIEGEIIDVTDLEVIKTGLITLKINNEIFIHLNEVELENYESIRGYNNYKMEEYEEDRQIERDFWSNLSSEEYEGYIDMYEK